MKILIADDSAFMRKILKTTLSELNHEAIEACNGLEAVNLYKEHRPNIVFLDIVMPEKTGILALKEIKEFDPSAIVIMCTSLAGQKQITDECISLQANDFINKPFKKEEIIRIISSYQK
jgi:two-component system, chemotaxis family, chemotaxis protein CheY